MTDTAENTVALALADQTVAFVTTTTVPLDRVAYTLCAALEGGSTYWCDKLKVADYRGYEWAHEAIAAGASFEVWTVHDGEVTPVANSLEHLSKTLKLMSDRHPRHWCDLAGETEDAETGDIFFQLLCFGEIVYG